MRRERAQCLHGDITTTQIARKRYLNHAEAGHASLHGRGHAELGRLGAAHTSSIDCQLDLRGGS
jgi:hypothetical protein